MHHPSWFFAQFHLHPFPFLSHPRYRGFIFPFPLPTVLMRARAMLSHHRDWPMHLTDSGIADFGCAQRNDDQTNARLYEAAH